MNKHKSSNTKLEIYSKPYVAIQQMRVQHIGVLRGGGQGGLAPPPQID